MRTYFKLVMMATVVGVSLAGCHDDNTPPTSPPAPTTTSFEGYAFSLVEQSSCDNAAPADINSIDFSFNIDQDTADPRSISTVSPACT